MACIDMEDNSSYLFVVRVVKSHLRRKNFLKKTRKSTLIGKSASTIKRTRKSSKKPIEQYEHKDKQRINNPPVGLVSEKTDIDQGKKTYRYDPHLDPELQFDNQRNEIENIIDSGLSAETIEQAKTALTELKKRQEPHFGTGLI